MEEEERIITLLREIAKRMSIKMNQIYAPYGLTAIQFEILTELYFRGSQHMSKLAKQMGMTNSNLSAIIKRMEKHGFVERNRDVMDQRGVYVKLCDPAYQLLENVKSDSYKKRMVLERCDKQNRKDILIGLEKLNQFLKECE